MPIVSSNSLIKLKVYFKPGFTWNGKTEQSFLSFLDDDKRGRDYSLRKMKKRLLHTKVKGQYTTAIIYDNQTGCEMEKWVDGTRVN